MKKLYIAGLGLLLLLALSLWAKNANFNLRTMMQTPINALAPTGKQSQSLPKSTPTVPVEILITVTPYGFVPGVITITSGTKITWVNKSGSDANISSDPHPTHTNYPLLNLGTFGMNSSVSLTFSKVGRFGYHNHLTPAQHGIIIVN